MFYFDCLARSFKRVSCLSVGLIWSHEVTLVKFLKFDMVIPKNLFSWGKRVCLSLVDQMTYFVWTRKWTYNLAIQKFVLFRSTILKCLKQSYFPIQLLNIATMMRKRYYPEVWNSKKTDISAYIILYYNKKVDI